MNITRVKVYQLPLADRLVLFTVKLVCPKKMLNNVKNILKQQLSEDTWQDAFTIIFGQFKVELLG